MGTLRALPKMDLILEMHKEYQNVPRGTFLRNARAILDFYRTEILANRVLTAPTAEEIAKSAARVSSFGLRKVINATGIVLHTNLGRAPLAPTVAEHVAMVAQGYCSLEYDVESGARGGRMEESERLLTELCKAEAAVAVNNNAAAVLLVLSSLCAGKSVIVSRGELVEIGGGFRIPEIISQGGATLTEVGTTNKVRLEDYAAAIDADTAALLKVHTSNFHIVGYTEEVNLSDLSSLARQNGIPLIYDLGGGALIRLSQKEPAVQEAINKGADVVCFSGDKLFGGPQAGIILGKKDYISKIRKHPLYRALRMDKLCIAALESTLRLYKTEGEIPVLAMLTVSPEELRVKAHRLLDLLAKFPIYTEVVETSGQAGGGSLPGEDFLSYAVAISAKAMQLTALEQALRQNETPIVARIHKGKLLMDVRTIQAEDFEIITKAFAEIFWESLDHE